MMKLAIKHQSKYSRTWLIFRTFLSIPLIVIPHCLLLFFVWFYAFFLKIIAFWQILFTGKYPQKKFNFQIKYMNWSLRVMAVLFHLVDEYPDFFPNGRSKKAILQAKRPEKIKWWLVLLRRIFGFIYVYIPHMLCLYGRFLASHILGVAAWFSVIITGKYPAGLHRFNVGTIRWMARLNLYMGYFSNKYPSFSGKAK